MFAEPDLYTIIEKANKTIRGTNENLEQIAEAYLTRGCCLFFEDREERGIEAVKKSLELYSGMNDQDAMRLKSEVVLGVFPYINESIDIFNEEITDWTNALQLDPKKRGSIFNYRGDCFFRKAIVIRNLEKCFKAIQPVNINYNKVIHDNSKSLFDLAIADYTEAISLKNWNGQREIAYIEIGEYDKAIADCNNALKWNKKNNERIFNLRGVVYDTKGDHDQAIADYTKAIELTPPKYRVIANYYYYNRGLAHDEKGEYELALADYTEAIHLNKINIRARNNRGILYRMLGQTDKAEEDIAKLYEEDLGETIFRCGRINLF